MPKTPTIQTTKTTEGIYSCYWHVALDNQSLRDKLGHKRRFKTQEAAQRAGQSYLDNPPPTPEFDESDDGDE